MSNTNAAFNEKYFGVGGQGPQLSKDDYLKKLPHYKIKHIVQFISSLPQGAVLLDMGCGSGKAIRLINSLRPDVKIIATDITNMATFLPEGTEFYQVSADDLDTVIAENSLDAVISEHVIEHMVYPNKMFENTFKLLKPGGKVYIETPNWTRLFMPFSPLYFWNDYTHIHPYSRTAFRRAFIEYGFNEQYVQSVSSIDFGRRFLKTRIEDGKIVTGQPSTSKIYKAPDSLSQKLFNALLDLFIHPFARDILIAVAMKPKV